ASSDLHLSKRPKLRYSSAVLANSFSRAYPTRCCPRSIPSTTCPTCRRRRRNFAESKTSLLAPSLSNAEDSRLLQATALLRDTTIRTFQPIHSTTAVSLPTRLCRSRHALRFRMDETRHPSDSARARLQSRPRNHARRHVETSYTPAAPHLCH